jgi:hypothetical protein
MTPASRLLTACVLLSTAPALAGDWYASLYTPQGLELRSDERVFTLFSLLNAEGYDAAPLARTEPVPRPRFHPVRSAVRVKAATTSPELRAKVTAFMDAHPQSIERYLAYTLHTEAPGFSAAPKGKEFKDLAGLESLLAEAWNGWKLDGQLGAAEDEFRAALRGYLPALDAPFERARKLLKVGEKGPAPVVVMNLLEAQGTVRGVAGEGEVALVVGPAEKPDVEPLVRAYAQVILEPTVAKKAKSWRGGSAVLMDARALGATETDAVAYATALFSRALALKAIDAPDAAYEAAAKDGYFGLKDIARAFDDARPVEAWAQDALAKAEARRPRR